MPASMINAPTGCSEKVSGISIAIVAIGPMPGEDADQRPDQHAHQAHREIDRRNRGDEAEPETGEDVHAQLLPK